MTKISRQQKLQYISNDIGVPCDKISSFLRAPPNSLNVTTEVGPSSELITETTNYDLAICSSGTRKTAKLTMVKEEEKANSSKVKSQVKRKSKFTNHSSKEDNEKKKKLMPNNVSDGKKPFQKRG